MIRRRRQQLGGLLIALLGAGLTAWTWWTAMREGYFYPKASMFFPAILVLGVALILFPGYREERISRGEDITRMQGWRLITRRWWVILAIAVAAGVGNYILLTPL